MKVQILNKEVNTMVRRDDDLKLALSKLNNVKVASIERWLRDDDLLLTTVSSLDIIRKHLGFLPEKALTEEKELQTA